MKKYLPLKYFIFVFAFLFSVNLFAVCDNVTTSGTVAGNETFCGPYGPSVITNVFYPTGGTGTLQYQWQVSADGTTWTDIGWATLESYTPNFISVTTYYRRLERRSGCTVYTGTSNIITKTVNPLPVASITAGGPVNFCGQVNVDLTANAAVGTTYQWKRYGVDIAGATNQIYNVTFEGRYSLIETIIATGCIGYSNDIFVTSSNFSPPGIYYTSTYNTCDTSTGLLGTGISNVGNSFQWYEDSILLPGAILSRYMTGHNGTYSCTMTNACGTFSSAPFIVNDPLLTNFPYGVITSNGITSICTGDSVDLYENSWFYNGSYQWFKDGVAIAGETYEIYTASQPGTYLLRFIFPCLDTGDPEIFYSNAITITNNGGTAPTPSISAGGITTPCPGQSVLLTEVTGPGWTYQWRKDGIQIPGATNSSYLVISTGSYQCYVSNFCGSFPSNTITITYQPMNALISVNGTGIICQGTTATLTSNTAGSGGTYQWKLNGSNISGATQITYGATITGSYTCSITNSCGTFLSNAIAITVAGSCGTGLHFDGINDYVDIPNNNAYSFGTGDFTIEVWVKIDATTTTTATIISNSAPGFAGFKITYSSTQILFSAPYPNSNSINRNLRDNVCHHVAISRVNSLITFFIDGIPYTSTANYGDITTPGNLRIGSSPIVGSYVKGNVMEVRMWNNGRTAAQILGSMNIQLAGNETGLVGYWRLNDGSGQVVNDYSFINNDGQLGSTTGTDVNDPTFQATCAIASAVNCNLPTGLNTTNITNISAQLNWGGAAADSFMVRYAVHNTTNFVWKKFSGQPNITSTTITGLLPATQYDWWVRSLCNGGSSSNYQANPAVFTTTNTPVPCVTPYNLNATNIGNTSATISWTNMVTADTFRVRYSVNGTTNFIWKDVNGTGGSSTSLTGLSPNTAYQFQVGSKCNGVTSPYSTSKVFTTLNTPVPCITPYNLGANNIQNTSATITWTNLVTADTFRVRYSVNGTTNFIWKDVNGTGGSSTSLSNLIPNTAYQFQVSSKCNGVTSAYSSSFVFTTLNIPVPCIVPYGLSTTNITNNSARINWTNLVSADTFRVRYSINGTTNYIWKDVSGAGGTTNTLLTGLNSTSTYQWQVRTICNGVQSAYSQSVIFSTAAMRSSDLSSVNGFENLLLYPNPAHTKSTAEFVSDKNGNGVVTVSDLTGRILYSEPFTIREGTNILEIDVATLPRGIYIVQLQNQNAASVMVKLAVE